jgi:hypothetical protein
MGAAIVFVIRFIQFRKSKESKNEIQTLQAKVSMLRMALKSKVKKKANSFRAKFVKSVNVGDPIDTALGELMDNKFETGDDFQHYFDLSKRINSYINAEIQSSNEANSSAFSHANKKLEDFMGPDLKNELGIIRIIKEITEASTKHNSKAELFNKLNPKAKIHLLNPLQFSSLAEVSRIFRDEVEEKESDGATSDQFEAA